MGLSAVFGPIGGHSREAIGLVNTGRLFVPYPGSMSALAVMRSLKTSAPQY